MDRAVKGARCSSRLTFLFYAIMRRPQKSSKSDKKMKHYRRKRIILSIIASLLTSFLVAGFYSEIRIFIVGSIILIAVLLPKIWWNFLLDRIREIAKAIKDNDSLLKIRHENPYKPLS